jgi:hypothetical protein
MRRVITAMTLISLFFFLGCYAASTDYYVKNQMTDEILENKMGKPARVDKLDVDTEKWVYPIQNTEAVGSRYYLVRDGKVLDTGIQY